MPTEKTAAIAAEKFCSRTSDRGAPTSPWRAFSL